MLRTLPTELHLDKSSMDMLRASYRDEAESKCSGLVCGSDRFVGGRYC
jgi:hypothetical protein